MDYLIAFGLLFLGLLFYIVYLERRLTLLNDQWNHLNNMLQFMSEKYADSQEEKRELQDKLDSFENPKQNEDQ